MIDAFVDFAFYTATYLGVTIPEAGFPRLALQATMMIEQMTFDRAGLMIEEDDEADAITIEKIKLATCAVAEKLYTSETTSGGGAAISSESLGNHSVSYFQGTLSNLSVFEHSENAARMYLGNTGLMFRGVT